jgi:hypothetical protein
MLGGVGDVRDLISLGVLGSFVPRDVVDEAITALGRDAKRRGGKLPPWVVVYLTMLMALHPDDDYEELAARLEPLVSWGGDVVEPATSGGVAQARARLGFEVLERVFEQVAVPVSDIDMAGAFAGGQRLVAIDGFEVDVPDTPENVEAFGRSGSGANASAFPKVRVVALAECASRAVIAAKMGPIAGKGSGERSLSGKLWSALTDDMLCLADAGFYSFDAWAAASATGADLVWRVGDGLRLPVVDKLDDGSYLSVITKPGIRDAAREDILQAARDGAELDLTQAHVVRVVEYDVPDRDGNGAGELIVLITTITDPRNLSATALAETYHSRWEAETAFDQVKTYLRPAGKVLRSKSPDMVKAEIYGLLLTQWALAALICDAATQTDTGPDRVKFARTIRIVRRHATSEAAFPP